MSSIFFVLLDDHPLHPLSCCQWKKSFQPAHFYHHHFPQFLSSSMHIWLGILVRKHAVVESTFQLIYLSICKFCVERQVVMKDQGLKYGFLSKINWIFQLHLNWLHLRLEAVTYCSLQWVRCCCQFRRIISSAESLW